MDPRVQRLGREAEDRAVRLLEDAGYRILARNLRTKSGEIDVIAQHGRVLVFVEVRHRAAHLNAAWRSLSRKKRACLVAAAREARRALRIPRRIPARFDVVLACADGTATHLRGALSTAKPYRA
jgi:putative endonuclease